MPEIASLLVECLGAGEVVLAEGSFSVDELKLIQGPVDGYNAVQRFMALTETKLGLEARAGRRLTTADVRLLEPGQAAGVGGAEGAGARAGAGGGWEAAAAAEAAEDSASMVLVVTDGQGEIVGAAELALHVPDGQLPSNFPALNAAVEKGFEKVFRGVRGPKPKPRREVSQLFQTAL